MQAKRRRRHAVCANRAACDYFPLDKDVLAACADAGFERTVVVSADVPELGAAFWTGALAAIDEGRFRRDQAAGKAVQRRMLVNLDASAVGAYINEAQVRAAAEITFTLAVLEFHFLQEAVAIHLLQMNLGIGVAVVQQLQDGIVIALWMPPVRFGFQHVTRAQPKVFD